MNDSSAKKNAADKALDRLQKHAKLQDASWYVDGLLKEDALILSQAITLVESSNPSHRELGAAIIQQSLSHSGKSIRIGITGVPGVGKSTFIEAFGLYLIGLGKKVAVLAIDPSSPVTKGSILGDKTRMDRLSMSDRAFIRPSPSSSSLGGVTRSTRESIILCEAAGFDVILIETVGVGQSETAVHELTDFFLLLMLAGAGDQLQGIKRGIMEMCDTILITKADGANLQAAKRAGAEYFSALHLFPPKESGWSPRVEAISAIENKGIDLAWLIVEEHEVWMKSRGLFEKKRKEQDLQWMHEYIKNEIIQGYFENPTRAALLKQVEGELLSGKMAPFEAARRILKS